MFSPCVTERRTGRKLAVESEQTLRMIEDKDTLLRNSAVLSRQL